MPFPILCSGAWVWTAPPIVLHFSGSTLLIQYTRVSFWLIFFSFYYFVCYSNCAFTYWWQSLVFICLFGWLIPYVFYWLVQLLFLVYFLFSYFEIFFIVIALMFESVWSHRSATGFAVLPYLMLSDSFQLFHCFHILTVLSSKMSELLMCFDNMINFISISEVSLCSSPLPHPNSMSGRYLQGHSGTRRCVILHPVSWP